MVEPDDLPPALSELSALSGAATPGRADNSTDSLGVAAIVVGCIGLVVFGIGLAVLTAVLAGAAGQRAREAGRSLENAYLAFALAGLDGVVWLVLHLIFDLQFIAG